MFLGDVAHSRQIGDDAVHGEHPVGGDETEAAIGRLLQFRLQVIQVGIPVAQPPCLAQADSVDDAGVVELVADDGILGIEQGFEQAAVGVETGTVQNGGLGAQKLGDPGFEIVVSLLGAADEADGREAVTPPVQARARRRDDLGMISQSQIVVGAHVQDRTPGDIDGRLLGTVDHPLPLVQPALLDLRQLLSEMFLDHTVHV